MSHDEHASSSPEPTEKPQNGIAGFKHLPYDILSGVVVSLVSLPLSSGIAIASGLPPIYGLTSAIIAGLLFPFIGGAYMTISGPAAGLAPAVMAVMVSLGGAGDADKVGPGYHYLLVVIFMVGCVQTIIYFAGLARYAAMIPVAVVEGMLCSIGCLIMVKQFSAFFGFTGKLDHPPHEFYQYVAAIPTFFEGRNNLVTGISLATLVALFVLGALQKKIKLFQVLPPQLLAVILGVVLSQSLQLGAINDGKFLIKIPSNLAESFHVQIPAFGELLAHKELWYAAIMGVVLLTMIDGVESLATAMAVDRIDPYRRRSDPNRVLLAMALSNMASSLIGGLTIIPGGVKSKVNIAAGGRTLWANFTNSICLILYLAVGYQMINLIPKGVLASVLLFTGWKMSEPLVWRHVAKIGKEQLFIFAFTVVCTLATDLLIGIIAGVIAKFFLNLYLCRRGVASMPATSKSQSSLVGGVSGMFTSPVERKEMIDGELHLHVDKPVMWTNASMLQKELDQLPPGTKSVVMHMEETQSLWQSVIGFFQNPVEHKELVNGEYHMYITRPLVCFNSMKLSEELEAIPEEATAVHVHIDERVPLIDHTSCDTLMYAVRESETGKAKMTIRGLEKMTQLSDHKAAVRVANGGTNSPSMPA